MKDRLNNLNMSLDEVKSYTINLLKSRGVQISDITTIVFNGQQPYNKSLTIEECEKAIFSVLGKREILHDILTGILIDVVVEKELIDSPIIDAIKNDDGLYGVDESIGKSIASLYGSIGYSNFGYLDKAKPGIIGELDNSTEQVNTFLDDIVCGIAAAACGRIAHNSRGNIF